MDIDDFWDAVESHSGACPDTADAQHELLEELFEEVALELPEPDEAWADAPAHTLVVFVAEFDAHVMPLLIPVPEGEDDLAMMDCLHVSAPDLARETPEAFPAALRLLAKLDYLTADLERMQRALDGIQGLCDAHGTETTLPSAEELIAMCGQWRAHAVGVYDADDEDWVDQECNAALLAKRIANVVVVRIDGDWV
jgi:hypothetical protein